MTTIVKSILAVALTAVGLQVIAEKFDVATASASSGDETDSVGGNGGIGW